MTKSIYFYLFIVINLVSGCNHLFYYPDSEVRVTPDKLNLKYDEILFHLIIVDTVNQQESQPEMVYL